MRPTWWCLYNCASVDWNMYYLPWWGPWLQRLIFYHLHINESETPWSVCWSGFFNLFLSLTATYFFFPKKHMPMLFHRGGLSGTAQAATLYLFMATSKSPWVCIMLPAARMAWEEEEAWEETALSKRGICWGSERNPKALTLRWLYTCYGPSYLIVVGVKCEGVSKMFECFLILSKLMR